MRKRFKYILTAVAGGFALLQLTNPSRTNPPVKNDFLTTLSPPPNISAMLRAACYDCHSHETKWPWYASIAPVSWGIVGDVNRARMRLDLSAWPKNEADRVAGNLIAMSDKTRSGEMPLVKYKIVHTDARLSKSQRRELADWLESQATNLNTAQPGLNTAQIFATHPSIGRTLFLKNCAHCHGADARGDEGPDLHGLDWTDKKIANQIREGKKGEMTAFAKKLSPEEIDSLVGYVRTLK